MFLVTLEGYTQYEGSSSEPICIFADKREADKFVEKANHLLKIVLEQEQESEVSDASNELCDLLKRDRVVSMRNGLPNINHQSNWFKVCNVPVFSS